MFCYWILPQSAKMGLPQRCTVHLARYWILPQSAKMGHQCR
ncbi:hypothetical protein L248_2374 [Schleiferilactobacillus shenzhenensis LY-73]|uniref:Uncharacterized protein n=1 Tax=Schleiferilactobacillus shenzhenensis LY-73 TaxID=1231336 RepID=U4TUY9_9LACO|nr:hypothetical protein L248_2374 [Schleiferilactobacillus shenzhenensis LY-73]